MTAREALLARREAVVARGVPRATDIVVDRAEGAVLIDVDGNEYLDLSSGIGVTTLGHSDPAVVAAIAEQAARLQHVCMHIATYEPYVALCERLTQLLPHGDKTKALLVNSGAEAVENAIKIARQKTRRSAVICFTGAFHGRTLLGMSLTSKVAYKRGCGPFAPAIHRLPFPDQLRQPQAAELELERLRLAFTNMVAPEDVAAILVEPVQGEGGFVVAPTSWLAGLRALCDEHGIVLIFDEVQTGFCRTGAWGAYQALGVTPDLSTWAKAMGGGLPIAAVVGRAEVIDGAEPGTVGGTFGGNPISCAAALATLQRMEELDLCTRADAVGELLMSRFHAMAYRHPEIVDVRGLGAMVAIELCHDGDPDRPAGSVVKSILERARSKGVLALSAGVHGNVLRMLPPLTIDDHKLHHAVDVLEAALAEVLP